MARYDEQCPFASALSHKRRRRLCRLRQRSTAAFVSLAHESASDTSVGDDYLCDNDFDECRQDSLSLSSPSPSIESACGRGFDMCCRHHARRRDGCGEEDDDEGSSCCSSCVSMNNNDYNADHAAHEECRDRGYVYTHDNDVHDVSDTDASTLSSDNDSEDALATEHTRGECANVSADGRQVTQHNCCCACRVQLWCGNAACDGRALSGRHKKQNHHNRHHRSNGCTYRAPVLECRHRERRLNALPVQLLCGVHEHIPARYGASQVTFGWPVRSASSPSTYSSSSSSYDPRVDCCTRARCVLWHGGIICASLPQVVSSSFSLMQYRVPAIRRNSASAANAGVDVTVVPRCSTAQSTALQQLLCMDTSSPIHPMLQLTRRHTTDLNAMMPSAASGAHSADVDSVGVGSADAESAFSFASVPPPPVSAPSLLPHASALQPLPRFGHCAAALDLSDSQALRWLSGSVPRARSLRAALQRIACLHAQVHSVTDIQVHLSLIVGGSSSVVPCVAVGTAVADPAASILHASSTTSYSCASSTAEVDAWATRYGLPSSCGAMAGYVRLPTLRELGKREGWCMGADASSSPSSRLPTVYRRTDSGPAPALCATVVYRRHHSVGCRHDGAKGDSDAASLPDAAEEPLAALSSAHDDDAPRSETGMHDSAGKAQFDAFDVLYITLDHLSSTAVRQLPALFATLTPWPNDGFGDDADGHTSAKDEPSCVQFVHLGGKDCYPMHSSRAQMPRTLPHQLHQQQGLPMRSQASFPQQQQQQLNQLSSSLSMQLHMIRLDPRNWSLTQRTITAHGVLPVARYGHSATVYRQHVYVFGGVAVDTGHCLADLQLLDTHTRVWREVYIPLPMAVPARAFHSAAVVRRCAVRHHCYSSRPLYTPVWNQEQRQYEYAPHEQTNDSLWIRDSNRKATEQEISAALPTLVFLGGENDDGVEPAVWTWGLVSEQWQPSSFPLLSYASCFEVQHSSLPDEACSSDGAVARTTACLWERVVRTWLAMEHAARHADRSSSSSSHSGRQIHNLGAQHKHSNHSYNHNNYHRNYSSCNTDRVRSRVCQGSNFSVDHDVARRRDCCSGAAGVSTTPDSFYYMSAMHGSLAQLLVLSGCDDYCLCDGLGGDILVVTGGHRSNPVLVTTQLQWIDGSLKQMTQFQWLWMQQQQRHEAGRYSSSAFTPALQDQHLCLVQQLFGRGASALLYRAACEAVQLASDSCGDAVQRDDGATAYEGMNEAYASMTGDAMGQVGDVLFANRVEQHALLDRWSCIVRQMVMRGHV